MASVRPSVGYNRTNERTNERTRRTDGIRFDLPFLSPVSADRHATQSGVGRMMMEGARAHTAPKVRLEWGLSRIRNTNDLIYL